MRLLLVHPSSLLYPEIFLRLEPLGHLGPLGPERGAGAPRSRGTEPRPAVPITTGRSIVTRYVSTWSVYGRDNAVGGAHEANIAMRYKL